MSGFMYEVKKIMFHQRGLFYIALVLLLGTVWLALSDSPYDNAMEQYKNEYEWYLEKVNGYCTEESSLYLEQEAERIAEAKERENSLLENYYDGKISESEYKKESREMEKVLEQQNGFEVIYQQYLYICENVGNRCFLQTNGWMGLLGKGTLNFILFLGILLIATPVFCSEYSCQMDTLILTSREGRKSSLYKLLIMITVVLFLSLSISLIEYEFYRFKYGLPNGDYPIQSIRYFADSSKGISLLEGYVYIGLLRMFGGVFLTILLMFLSVLAKKYAITLLTGAVSVIIPYIGLSKTSVYRLPLPLPFLLGTDFFSGDIVLSDALTGDDKIIFAEVNTVMLLTLLFVSVFLCTLAVVWILRRNSNRWLMRSGQKKRAEVFVVILSLALALTGCSGRGKTESVVYNSSADYDCMGYEIIRDAGTFDYCLKNTSTGATYSLVRSPMFGVFSDEEEVRAFYVCPPYLYYTTSVMESYVNRVGNYNSNITKVSVIELNLNTFEEKIIFEQITNSGRSLLGIDYVTGDKWKFLDFHHAFFLSDENIFFIDNDGITKVNRSTRKIVKLDIPTNGNISFDGESIFYKNKQGVLTRYYVSSNETYTYENIVAYDFCMDEQSIYYVSRTDGGCLYSCGKDGNNRELISNIPAMSVTCDTGNIYVLSKEGGEEIVIQKKH
ncbi:MAG: DUF5050 domain-containing protein [Lachnospiraceae bacterium]|nr:DUF5050 domain-containing protein [Lachnospiraceae bacterium]